MESGDLDRTLREANRNFELTDRRNSCAMCSRICPVDNIKMVGGRPPPRSVGATHLASRSTVGERIEKCDAYGGNTAVATTPGVQRQLEFPSSERVKTVQDNLVENPRRSIC